jgi:pyruvate,water dikinase
MEGKPKFINPHEVPVLQGVEGWQRLYPYYYRFVEKGVDPEMEEYENSNLWFVDNLHQTGPLLPFESIVDDLWWPSLNQISTRMVCFPTSRGLDHRMLYGWSYLSSPEETDPVVIDQKARVVQERMNYYFGHWDEILPQWKEKQLNNAKRMDEIRFNPLPDIVGDDYIHGNVGHSPAHELRMDYYKLIQIADLCWEQHFELFNVGLAAYLVFSDLCTKLFPGITDKTIGSFCSSGSTYDSYLPEFKLQELARLAIDRGVADAIMQEGDADAVEQRLATTEAGRTWQKERDKYRDPYFYVGTGFSMMTHEDVTWNEDLNMPLAILREYLPKLKRGEKIGRDLVAKQAETESLVAQYRSYIKDEKDTAMFDQLLPLARRGAQHAESHMFWGETQYQPRQYKKLNELGNLFVSYGMLEKPDDLYYLNRWEIPTLIQDLTNAWSGRTRPTGTWYWKKEIPWRRDVYKRFEDWSPTPFLGAVPEKVTDPFTIGLWGITGRSIEAYLKGAQVNIDEVTELEGFQAAAGSVEGRARVLTSVHDIKDIKEGEILVVTLTSPTWGPAFSRIKGCVTDIGGMMSHAAIICREYGIAAVTGTGFATKAIKTGDIIAVDGDNGMVKIKEKGPRS